jgi:phosphoribosyl-ATP pyrophosphohydrolase
MSDTEGLTDDQMERIYSFGVLVRRAHIEATKAMKRFPQPNYVISKIAEEAGEVVKAAIHCAEKRETPENVEKEMTQLLAMLIRLWVEGDQVHGLPPISEMGKPND